MTNLYVDVNILQSVPSSNINRGETGEPKTALYGGVTRARVSSQSWKRAIRIAFKDEATGATWLRGIRTKRAPELLAQELRKLKPELTDEAALDRSVEVFNQLKITLDKKTNQTSALLMVTPGELEKIASYVTENEDLNAKTLKAMLRGDQSLDMALFGRMVANDKLLAVDAASQIAHAISTHEVEVESDYYAALDDAQPASESGAANLGSIEYDSATLYRYANVNVTELIHNLGSTEVALEGLKLFVKDFILSMPTGKQNTFANKTLPQYVMVTVRTDTPVNLVSAFEEPVRSKSGYIDTSIKRMEAEYGLVQAFVDTPVLTKVLTTRASSLGDDQVATVTELIDQVASGVSKQVDDDEDVTD